jgi:hypothetical protein
MEIRVVYETDEINQLVLAEHNKHFVLPAGQKWVLSESFGRITVENVTNGEPYHKQNNNGGQGQ